MPTMTIRYPQELESVIKELMTATDEKTKNGAINIAIEQFIPTCRRNLDLIQELHQLECKYNNLLSRVEIFATAQQKLFDFTELK